MKTFIYKILIFIINSVPNVFGLHFILRKIKFIPKEKFYKDFKLTSKFNVPVYNGYSFTMNSNGFIENETFWKGLFKTFERESGWLFINLSKKLDFIIDIGANTGIYSLTAACINNNAIIHAFEPSKHTFHKLEANCKINKFKIICNNFAISDFNGISSFYDEKSESQTGASLSKKRLEYWKKKSIETITYKVKTLTFDEYISQNNLDDVNIIKIDVEMHEPQVIRGMKKTLNNFKPILFIEILSKKIGEEISENFNDYWEFYHLEYKKLTKVSKLVHNKNPPYYINYLIIHKEKTHHIKEFL